MKQFLTLASVVLLSTLSAHSQTRDLVLFSDDGTKFTLIVDGDVKNAAPAGRVIATGIRTETPLVIVRFEDASLPQIKKPLWLEADKEYTVMVTTNKKGERVLRPTGEAALGTAAKAEPEKPMPTAFQEDKPARSTTAVTQTDGSVTGGQMTTVTVVEEQVGGGSGTTDGVNMNVGINGMGINMNVGVTERSGSGSTTPTRTTTTKPHTSTSSNITTAAPVSEPVKPAAKEPDVYRMPGYSGPVGCGWPMNDTEFNDAKKSIESKGFEETKMTMAKQIGKDRCFTAAQVKGVLGIFGFEDSRLEFAKYAYERTYDIGNYYKVNDAFSFESSVEELNEYISTK